MLHIPTTRRFNCHIVNLAVSIDLDDLDLCLLGCKRICDLLVDWGELLASRHVSNRHLAELNELTLQWPLERRVRYCAEC